MRGQVRQWLLCALVLSLISMHHLALAQHEPHVGGTHAASSSPMTVEELPEAHCPGPASGGGHAVLHPCEAVLHTPGGFLLLVLLTVVGVGVRPPPTGLRLPAARPRRPPGIGGRTLLASVCVLRV